jgi:hypothetical protein
MRYAVVTSIARHYVPTPITIMRTVFITGLRYIRRSGWQKLNIWLTKHLLDIPYDHASVDCYRFICYRRPARYSPSTPYQ